MPQRVAVVGASADRRKFGNKAVRAYRDEGYVVYPINTHETEIEGLPVYRSVLDVPEPLDIATVYVHPEIGLTLLADFARKRIPEIWLNPGAESDELRVAARELKLNIVEACSIMGIGRSPSSF